MGWKLVLDKTAKDLNFVWGKAPSNPNALGAGGQANCVGYAAYFAAIFNRCNKDETTAEHWRAQIYFFGYNIHSWIKNPFFKDHDIVILRSKDGQIIKKVDPSLYDYFGIAYVN